MVKPITFLMNSVVVVTLIACSSNVEGIEAKLEEARYEIEKSHNAYEQVAEKLVSSSIVWANQKNVRYKFDAEFKTENWEIAQLPSILKMELQSFMITHKVEAIFVAKRRVNFVLQGFGIGPSGVSFGVIVAAGNEHGCKLVSKVLELDGRGLNCEQLDGKVYFYLDR